MADGIYFGVSRVNTDRSMRCVCLLHNERFLIVLSHKVCIRVCKTSPKHGAECRRNITS